MENTALDALDRSSYIRAISLTTLVMILVVATGAKTSWAWPFSVPLLLGSFIGAVAFILLFTISENPAISLIGVSGMSFLIGIQIGPVFSAYAAMYKGIVQETLLVTGGIMSSMSVAGLIVPTIFEGLAPFLMAGLFTLIWVQLAQLLLGALGFTAALDVPLITWGGVLLFALFVAWDWVAALKKPHTLDNAIDAAGGLVLDFVNIAVRILDILAKAKSK